MKNINYDRATPDSLLPRNQIFNSPREQKFLGWYRSFFSIKEIETSTILQWVFGALLLTYYVTFSGYVARSIITIESYINNTYTCWPYFQSCGQYYFLSTLPYGYTQPILYSFFFGIMTLIAVLMWKKDWVLAHMLLSVLFIWRCLVLFVLTGSGGGNYDYYDIIFTLILLALPFKLFFIRLAFVLLYFLAATIKIHEGWILGSYFTALQTGLPLFPDNLTPLFTNLVIFMQIVGAWFLLSSNKLLQRTALFYFLCFHFYSGILVYYRYLTTTIPLLIILFGVQFSALKTPLNRKSIPGWVLVVALFCLQFTPIIIAGDQKMTLEGNQYGLYMFEANHQCMSSQTVTFTDGSTTTKDRASYSARNRCDPYQYWFNAKQTCERYGNIASIAWTFDHSINGGPFYRIVDEANICELEYKAFKHNNWIKLPADNPEIIGYPVKNVYF